MGRSKTILLLLLGALLLVDAGNCFAAAPQQDQDMDCCRSMACSPASWSMACCNIKDSTPAPRVLPQVRVSLAPPVLAVVGRVATSSDWRYKLTSPIDFIALLHSPPDLYTLHLSLLI